MSYTNTELSEAIREAIDRCRESNKVESNLQCRNCTEQARYKLKQNNHARYLCAYHYGIGLGQASIVAAWIVPFLFNPETKPEVKT